MVVIFLLTSKWYIVAPHFGVGYNINGFFRQLGAVIAAPQNWVAYIPAKWLAWYIGGTVIRAVCGIL